MPDATQSPAAPPPAHPAWPHDDTAALIAYYGNPDASGYEAANMVKIATPWPLTYAGKPWPHQFEMHRRCADSLNIVLADIAAHFKAAGVPLPKCVTEFSGSYVNRAIRGSVRKSCHAFGAAIDFDADENEMYSTGHMHPYVIEAFKKQGWYWGGDFHSRKDPMHFQAAHE